MFLAWAILNNLVSLELYIDWPEEIASVKSRQITGRDFLFRACDEKFWESDLSDEGNAFAAWNYSRPDGTMPYVEDYANVLAEDLPTIYHVMDTWENYDKVAPIDGSAAYAEWKVIEGRA